MIPSNNTTHQSTVKVSDCKGLWHGSVLYNERRQEVKFRIYDSDFNERYGTDGKNEGIE